MWAPPLSLLVTCGLAGRQGSGSRGRVWPYLMPGGSLTEEGVSQRGGGGRGPDRPGEKVRGGADDGRDKFLCGSLGITSPLPLDTGARRRGPAGWGEEAAGPAGRRKARGWSGTGLAVLRGNGEHRLPVDGGPVAHRRRRRRACHPRPCSGRRRQRLVEKGRGGA